MVACLKNHLQNVIKVRRRSQEGGTHESPGGDIEENLYANKKNLLGGLGVGDDGNLRDHIGGGGWIGKVLKDKTGKGD